ncbi:MAG: hypothetical protein ACW987_01445 [Candidatus Thorarchaeota archaeon]
MTGVMLCAVCVDANLRGHGVFYGLGHDDRYYHENSVQLQGRMINRNLSSSVVYESHSTDATLILFDNRLVSFLTIPFGDYNGSFLQITNPMNSGSEFNLNRFSDYGFNDVAASLMEVNTRSMFRYSFRDLFLQDWRTSIDDELGGRASRTGDPIMTWEMWPQNISFLDANQRYLKISQKIRIDVNNWWDYDASITYHLRLFLDGSGRLRGRCVRWAYWVESGMKSGQIAERLEPLVITEAR